MDIDLDNSTLFYIEEDAIALIQKETNYDVALISSIMSFLWEAQDNVNDMEAFTNPAHYLKKNYHFTNKEIIDNIIIAETNYLKEIGAIED